VNLWPSLRMTPSQRKIVFVLLAAGLLLCLFVFRPAAGRLQSRIVRSISAAVGRPVEISSVNLRFFPHPGFDLENFVVYDDPDFSAEPMLRASEVTARLRLRSLLRGRIQIARLDLTEPSLNLVERNGRWNLESLLQGNGSGGRLLGQIQRRSESPDFPYIEASQGRINFKRSQEKTPYALTDTDFSFWQNSDHSWGVRLKAQPWRSDYNLSDMGILRVEGTWAGDVARRDTEVQFSADWDGAQLGQISKYFSGRDAGWRGGASLTAVVTGKLSQLNLQTDLTVRDFRRFDAPGNAAIRLETSCNARYGDQNLSDIACSAPIGDGVATLQSDISADMKAATFTVIAQDIPVTSLSGLARSTATGFANGAQSGRLEGKLRVTRSLQSDWKWQGSGEVRDLRLRGSGSRDDVAVGSLPVRILSEASDKRRETEPTETVQVELGPIVFLTEPSAKSSDTSGPTTPLIVRAQLSRHSYFIAAQGVSPTRPLLAAMNSAGLWNTPLLADGSVKLDLHAAGEWNTRPKLTGTFQVRELKIRLAGTSAPIEMASARLALESDAVLLQGVKAEVAGTYWTGSMKWPRPCAAEACAAQFDVHADTISTDALSAWFRPTEKTRSWYQFLSSASPNDSSSERASLLPSLLKWRAMGTLKADRVSIRKLQASGVSANVAFKQGKLSLTNLRGTVLGGKHSGQWTADFAAYPPSYGGSGTLDNVAAENIGALINSGWISGLASGSYDLKMSGWNTAELLASSDGQAQITLRSGTLSHWTPEQTGLTIQRFEGTLSLHQGDFQVADGEMQTADTTYAVTGTASWGKDIHLQFTREGLPAVVVTGTIGNPKIAAASAAEASAQLKP